MPGSKNTKLTEVLRDRPRRMQRLAVVIMVLGMGAVLLQPLLRGADGTVPIGRDGMRPISPADKVVLPIEVSEAETPVHAAKVALGRDLFFDEALSPKGMACVSCHRPEQYGTLHQPRSPSLTGSQNERNVPTVLNVALNSRFGWDGALHTLAEQLDDVINNPSHMGSSWDFIQRSVASKPAYRTRFQQLYAGKVDRASIADALVAFERVLLTPGSPFDRYLQGERDALSHEQREGFERFRRYGCIACHQGRNLGGNMTARYGIFGDPFKGDGADGEDPGLFRVTGRKADRHVFRVPSLRNVAETAPYLHDGSATDLEEAVRRMARYQLGQEMPEADVRLVAAFLRSLTAPLPEVFR